MNEKVKQLLTGLGVNAQTIADLQDDEKVEALDVTKVKDETMVNLRNRLKNDAEFKGEIERGLRASILGSKESKMMKAFDFLGVSQDEIDALPEKNKYDAMIDLFAEKANEKSQDPATDEKVKLKIKQLNDDLRKEKEEKKKLLEEDIPKIKGEVEAEKIRHKMEQFQRKSLSKHKLIIDPDFAFNSVNSTISEDFDVRPDAAGKPKVYEKGTDNEAYDENNNLITYDTLTEKIVNKHNLVKRSNANNSDDDDSDPGDGGDGKPKKEKYNLPGLGKAREHEKALKKQTTEE